MEARASFSLRGFRRRRGAAVDKDHLRGGELGIVAPPALDSRGVSSGATVSRPAVDEVIHVAEFRVALRRFHRETERVARACGLTPQRYLLLLLVKGAPDGSESATVTGLAARLHLAQSTVTELVARAEDAGLLAREPSPIDGRVVVLRLTDEGEERLACAFSGLDAERRRLRDTVEDLD